MRHLLNKAFSCAHSFVENFLETLQKKFPFIHPDQISMYVKSKLFFLNQVKSASMRVHCPTCFKLIAVSAYQRHATQCRPCRYQYFDITTKSRNSICGKYLCKKNTHKDFVHFKTLLEDCKNDPCPHHLKYYKTKISKKKSKFFIISDNYKCTLLKIQSDLIDLEHKTTPYRVLTKFCRCSRNESSSHLRHPLTSCNCFYYFIQNASSAEILNKVDRKTMRSQIPNLAHYCIMIVENPLDIITNNLFRPFLNFREEPKLRFIWILLCKNEKQENLSRNYFCDRGQQWVALN